MRTVTINITMTEAMYKRVMPTLKAMADVHEDRKLSMTQAIEKYGWTRSTLYRWAVTQKRIPYTQPVENGGIFFMDSDLKKFAEGQIGRPERKKGKRSKGRTEEERKLDLIVM